MGYFARSLLIRFTPPHFPFPERGQISRREYRDSPAGDASIMFATFQLNTDFGQKKQP
jgi:hypothetical protein